MLDNATVSSGFFTFGGTTFRRLVFTFNGSLFSAGSILYINPDFFQDTRRSVFPNTASNWPIIDNAWPTLFAFRLSQPPANPATMMTARLYVGYHIIPDRIDPNQNQLITTPGANIRPVQFGWVNPNWSNPNALEIFSTPSNGLLSNFSSNQRYDVLANAFFAVMTRDYFQLPCRNYPLGNMILQG
ncbi:MAG: hypothetical protein FWE37_02590 [Spirochaetaceae bacterium]|nr:hypothetical protein [Spirochaetaceae bacterium]